MQRTEKIRARRGLIELMLRSERNLQICVGEAESIVGKMRARRGFNTTEQGATSPCLCAGTGLSTCFRANATEEMQRETSGARMFRIAGDEGHNEPTEQNEAGRMSAMEN